MAKHVGTSRQNIENLEAKPDMVPRYVAKLAKALGVTVDDLITGHAAATLTFTAAAIGSTAGPTPPADYSPEALILAKWLDKLPPGKAKDDVFSACMELLNAAVRGNPEQTPAPAVVHRRGRQNA